MLRLPKVPSNCNNGNFHLRLQEVYSINDMKDSGHPGHQEKAYMAFQD